MKPTNKWLSQIWRFVRIWALTFGASILSTTMAGFTGVHSLPMIASIVIGLMVAAAETTYRTLVPAKEQSKLITAMAVGRSVWSKLAAADPAEAAVVTRIADEVIGAVKLPASLPPVVTSLQSLEDAAQLYTAPPAAVASVLAPKPVADLSAVAPAAVSAPQATVSILPPPAA